MHIPPKIFHAELLNKIKVRASLWKSEVAARVCKGALEIEVSLSGAYLYDKREVWGVGVDEGVKFFGNGRQAGLEKAMHMDNQMGQRKRQCQP